MPNFSYVARSKTGEIKKGEITAPDKNVVVTKLRDEGFPLVTVKEEAAIGKSTNITLKFLNRVSLLDKILFAKHLGVMIEAGIPLSRALKTLAAQATNPVFSEIIKDVSDNINKGKSFADSLKSHEDVFGELFVNMVSVGEVSGNMEKVLKVLVDQMKKDYELMGKVKGAMMYPSIVLSAMVLIGIVMMTFVVPKLLSVFEEMNVELPESTKLVMAITDVFENYGVFVLIAIPIIGALMGMALKTKGGQKAIDTVLLKAPVVGELAKKINQARFARTLSSLIRSGVPIVEGLRITSNTLSNYYYKESLKSVSVQIEKGKSLGESLTEQGNIYAPIVTEMIAIGEETGTLDSILEEIADFYETEVDEATKNLSSIIEPVLMIFIGIAVGFFAVSMIQPMYSLTNSI